MKNFIYKIIDLLVLGKGIRVTISGITLRLPTRYFRYYPKDYEQESVRFFKQSILPGQVVLDIGAQMGLMTKIFSDLVGEKGKVYSFEPTPGTFLLLQKTIQINNIGKNVTAIQQAVAEKKGTAFFTVSDQPADSSNSLARTSRAGNISEIEVKLVSVDSFKTENNIEHIHFMKIDAEGAELAVLKGAANTLLIDRPTVNLALHPKALKDFGSSLHEIHQVIQQQAYTILYKGQKMEEQAFVTATTLFDVQLIPRESKS